MLSIPAIDPNIPMREGVAYKLIAAERERMETAFAELGSKFSIRAFKKNSLFDCQQPHVYKAITEAFANCLMADMRDHLKNWFYNRETSPVVYIEGFPVGEVQETPRAITTRAKPHISEFISIGLLGLAGRQIQELKIANVVLREEDNLIPVAEPKVMFEPFHTHADLSDYGVLYCIKGSEKVSSLIATAERAVFAQNEDMRHLLFKPLRACLKSF